MNEDIINTLRETELDHMVITINQAIQYPGIDKNDISDGYHTFGELYEHRIVIYIALCRILAITPAFQQNNRVWKSKKHSDGSSSDGWFMLGINQVDGTQITYHLPEKYWDKDTWFAETVHMAPAFDGHTSADVLHRLAKLI